MKVTIDITNKELDALEDYIHCVIEGKKEKLELYNISSKVWQKLVRAYDNKNENKKEPAFYPAKPSYLNDFVNTEMKGAWF